MTSLPASKSARVVMSAATLLIAWVSPAGKKPSSHLRILVAAVVYQFDIDKRSSASQRFHFVMVDEMFSKVDDHYAEYAMRLFESFGLQLLIVAPFDAKAKITEPFVEYYLHVVKQDDRSQVFTMTATEFLEAEMEE